jgi:hypothetical protein
MANTDWYAVKKMQFRVTGKPSNQEIWDKSPE